jgi:hypothetical protein
MKSTSWKKHYVVILHSDYDNTWIVRTKSLTLNQAIKYATVKNLHGGIAAGTVKIVSLEELKEMGVPA